MNEEARQERRALAYHMARKGFGSLYIAKQLGISDRQVRKDIVIIRAQNGKSLKKDDYLKRIGDYNYNQNERVKKLWGIALDKDEKKSNILKALSDLRSEDDQSIKKDQIVGLLPKEQSPLTIESNTNDDGISNIQINIIQQQEEQIQEKVQVIEQKPEIMNKKPKK